MVIVWRPCNVMQAISVAGMQRNPGTSPKMVGQKKWAPEGAHRYQSEKENGSEVVVESDHHVPADGAVLMKRRVVGQEYAS